MQFVQRSVRASVGDTPRRGTSLTPSALSRHAEADLFSKHPRRVLRIGNPYRQGPAGQLLG